MLNVEAKWSKFRCFGKGIVVAVRAASRCPACKCSLRRLTPTGKGIVVAVRAASREAKRIDATKGLSHQGDCTSHQGDCLDGIDEECITPARLGLREAAMKEGKKAGMLVQKVS